VNTLFFVTMEMTIIYAI